MTFYKLQYKGWSLHVFEQVHIPPHGTIGASAVRQGYRLGTGAFTPDEALRRIMRMCDKEVCA